MIKPLVGKITFQEYFCSGSYVVDEVAAHTREAQDSSENLRGTDEILS